MASDRIFGLVALFVALAYIASATQIQNSFLSDPVGPKAYPKLVGGVAAISALFMIVKPDANPEWPKGSTWLALGFAVMVLVIYAYSLKPLGFIIPTALAAGVLSFQIYPNWRTAAMSGLALSIGLFLLFKYGLDLGLVPFPKAWLGG